METLSIILNFILASGLAGTILFFNAKKRKENAAADSAELANTEKVGKLEIIIEHKDVEIDRSRIVIRQAYKCETPPEHCPVLLKRAELERKRKENDENNRKS